MIVAFAHESDMNRYLSEHLILHEFQSFKATINGPVALPSSTENSSLPPHPPTSHVGLPSKSLFFFAISSVDHALLKAQNLEAFELLRSQGHTVEDSSIIEQAWMEHLSWGPCFDCIFMLCESCDALILCDHEFSLDAAVLGLWLPQFPDLRDGKSSISLDGGQWELSKYYDETEELREIPSADGWEIVDDFTTMHLDDEGRSTLETSETPSATPTTVSSSDTGIRRSTSYKDMLLKNGTAERKEESNATHPGQQARREWKPTFVIAKVPRLRSDRQYGPTAVVYDDEEDGCWDIHDSAANVKVSALLSRCVIVTVLSLI